jgi:hypothetical protein
MAVLLCFEDTSIDPAHLENSGLGPLSSIMTDVD